MRNAHPETPPGALEATTGTLEILDLLRSGKVLTKTEIAVRTELSRSTVNQRLDALLEAGLVIPSGAESTKGRPAGSFAFNRGGGYFLVADIGATAMRAGLCDLTGAILDEVGLPVDVTDGPTSVLGRVKKEFAALLAGAGAGPESVLGTGVSVPGPVDTGSGQVVHPPIMTGWDGYDIPGAFSSVYNCPVIVDKDANAMAFGEQQSTYPDVRHLLMVKIGTGVGSGLISDGRLHRGADGAAGDIGHNYVSKPAGVESEPECRCGNTGCLEAYAGGWALVRDLRAQGLDVHSVDDAVRLLRAGERNAVRLARTASRLLGEAIAATVNLFNPQVVVLGGQLAAAEEYYFAGIREAVYRRSLPLATRHLRIVGSTLESQAGVVGIALLVAQSVFTRHLLPRIAPSPKPAAIPRPA
ncbi:sugar kinase [Zafaria cholistanensis]|uniref:Sugar kinase n=1 Tax=Zafaria cholistanensis TaxID=1682741 RepID=A0A5A7NVQ2_9MICC|nr:ROK family transcriptional regulator [Zafaria cholistanensis]GER24317.1 sugar kinase [Zafaria cholistanensis]